MNTRRVILAGILIAFFMAAGLFFSAGLASPLVEGGAPKPTQPAPTQPLPPAVETGANAPLVIGGAVLLLIIVGGVAWSAWQKKSAPVDH